MSDTLINPRTERALLHLADDLPQSVLLTGPEGVGLLHALEYLVRALGTTPIILRPEKDEKEDLEKGSITVEMIRRLYDWTRSVPGGVRIIAIEKAERMGIPAQNAFLKLLEEPGEGTHFILLTHRPSTLLPTVLSRLQSTEVQPLSEDQSDALLDQLGVNDPRRRTQLLFMASGLAEELVRLAEDKDYFEHRADIVKDAQEFIKSGPYGRIKLAHKYKDSRADALTLLDDVLGLLRRNISSGHTGLLPVIDRVLTAQEHITANGNIRLQLSAVMV